MLTELIEVLASAPDNPNINLAIGREYHARQQLGAAIGFYLRAAERSDNNELTYAALCSIATAFDQQRGRPTSVANALAQAVTVLPDRPEALYLLSKHYELAKDWRNSYLHACLGLARSAAAPLPHHVDYPGSYALLFQKAVAGYWLGKKYEALDIFHRLKDNPQLDPLHKIAVQNNLDNIG